MPFVQVRFGICAGAEAVHQNKPHIGVKLSPCKFDLLGNQVEEGIAVLDLKKALGLLQAHGGP